MREYELKKLEFERIKNSLRPFLHSEASSKALDELKFYESKEDLIEALNILEDLINILKHENELGLYNFEDIRPFLKKSILKDSRLFLDEIQEIYKVIKLMKDIKKKLSQFLSNYKNISYFLKNIQQFQLVESEIERVIDPNLGIIREDASRDLSNIKKEIRLVEKSITERLESLFQRPDSDALFSEKIITIRQNRYVVPVRTQNVKRIAGIVHGVSSSGQTTFLEPQIVVELNNKLSMLKSQEETEINKILKKLTEYIGDFANKIISSFEGLIELDIFLAKAKFAIITNSNVIKPSNKIKLLEVRNPIMVLLNKEVVPVDIIFEKKGVILTGANTGGKTVALKTLGMSYLMFYLGMAIPASKESELVFLDDIFVDIGDEQSIDQSLSTFSSHIVNISNILNSIKSPNTLVILDELGSGTDPLEGSAIGIGILDYLMKKNVYCIVSTHHTPIKSFAISTNYFIPASVMFDKESFNPLYKIIYKSVGQSMAFDIALAYNIPSEIIEKAKEFMGKDNASYKEAVENLESLVNEYREKIESLEKHRLELEALKRKYEELNKELEEVKAKNWEDVLKEAKKFLEDIEKESYSFVKSLKDKLEVKRFISSKMREIEEKMPKISVKVEVGDWVEFMGGKGRVIEIKGDRAQVVFGDIKAWVNLKDITKTTKAPQVHKPATPIRLEQKKAGTPEINLLGLSVEEAIAKLEKFLDSAIISDIKVIKIIHGTGSGVLKNAIRDYLEHSSLIKFYREAYPKEGGSGATMVYL